MSDSRGPFLNRSIEDMQKAEHVAQTQDLCRTCKKWYDTGAVHDHPEKSVEERHEFHLLLNQTAYCICGWAVSRSSPIGHLTKQEARAVRETLDDVTWFSKRYREHL